jgi:cytoskeletal protein RodZ
MSDFGGKLRLARERRGITLRQIAANTKISVAVLEALERNDVSKLPGGIFSRAFVRSYALEVGLDPDKTVQEFLERFESQPAVSTDEVHSVPEEESSFESQQRMAHVVLTLVLISVPLIGVVLYFTLRTPRSTPTPAPTAAAEPAAAPSPPSREVPSASNAPSPTVLPNPPATAPVNQSVNTAPMTLDLHPTSDCWVKLVVDGRTAVSRVMHAGEHEIREVHETAVIDVGDAGAFAYSINGRPGKPLGAGGQVRTIRITKETFTQYVQ